MYAVVKMIQIVVMATEINRGRKREILEKQPHILVTVIIQQGGREIHIKCIHRGPEDSVHCWHLSPDSPHVGEKLDPLPQPNEIQWESV